MDQREWSVVNGQLRQHGLPPVDVVYAGTVPTPTGLSISFVICVM